MERKFGDMTLDDLAKLEGEATVLVGSTTGMAAPVMSDQRDALLEEGNELLRENQRLRALLRAWEPRVLCPQCGQRYLASPCGPSHADVAAALKEA